MGTLLKEPRGAKVEVEGVEQPDSKLWEDKVIQSEGTEGGDWVLEDEQEVEDLTVDFLIRCLQGSSDVLDGFTKCKLKYSWFVLNVPFD